MGLFDRWRTWSLAGEERPWPSGASIYDFLTAHTEAATGKLSKAGQRLPDEPTEEPNQIRFAAGALDGVLGHHAGAADEALRIKQLEKALVDVLTSSTAARLAHLHRLATGDALLGVVDKVLDSVASNPKLLPERVHALGVVLAREAPHREAVKLGLALMGTVQGSDDVDLLLQLGAHDEFTLFAAVALVNRGDGAERALFRLAQRVDGWGRIQVVERLSQTQDAEIQGWMLREGFRNSVMDEYLAYTCAMTGGLHVALAAPSIEPSLLRGAAGILAALANGGPAEDLSDYPHAEAAVGAFLRHLATFPLDLELVGTLDALSLRSEVPVPLKEHIDQLRSVPPVRALIDAGLASASDEDYFRATQAARARGIDTFDAHERRVHAGNLDAPLFNLMRSTTDATIERALAAVMPHLDLPAIATGPADSLGLGPDYAQHRNLGFVVQELPRFPGKGTILVLAALGSPVVNNRHMALRTLASWTRPRWPSTEILNALDLAIRHEPLDDLKRRMQNVRDGGSYEEDHGLN